MNGDYAGRPRAEPAAIADAPAADLFRLLTAIFRAERFCEGAFLEAAEDGTLSAITRRAAELHARGADHASA